MSNRHKSATLNHIVMKERQWYRCKEVGLCWIFDDTQAVNTPGQVMYEELDYIAEYKDDMVRFTLAHFGSVTEALAAIIKQERNDDDTDSMVSDTELVHSAYNVCAPDEEGEQTIADDYKPRGTGYFMETGVSYNYKGWIRQNGVGPYTPFDGSIQFTPYGLSSRCPLPIQTFASARDFWDC